MAKLIVQIYLYTMHKLYEIWNICTKNVKSNYAIDGQADGQSEEVHMWIESDCPYLRETWFITSEFLNWSLRKLLSCKNLALTYTYKPFNGDGSLNWGDDEKTLMCNS